MFFLNSLLCVDFFLYVNVSHPGWQWTRHDSFISSYIFTLLSVVIIFAPLCNFTAIVLSSSNWIFPLSTSSLQKKRRGNNVKTAMKDCVGKKKLDKSMIYFFWKNMEPTRVACLLLPCNQNCCKDYQCEYYTEDLERNKSFKM